MELEKKSLAFAEPSSSADSQDRYIQTGAVCAICGGVSEMTLWRWLKDEYLNFPRPIKIQTRRYWRESEIFDWLSAQSRE